MSMVLFNSELRRHRLALAIWVIVLSLMSLMRMAEFPDFAKKYQSADQALSEFSPTEIEMFGLDGVDLTSITGYYGARVFSVVVLLGAVYVTMLAATILSREEDYKTIEFLLATPLSRTSITTSKIAVVMLYTFAFNLALLLTSWVMCVAFQQNGYDAKALALMSLGSFLIHLMFAAVGFLLSVFVTPARVIYPVAIGIVLGAYVIQMIANSNEQVKPLTWLSFFTYPNVGEVSAGGHLIDAAHLTAALLLIVAGFGLAVFRYQRKDIVG